MKKTIILMTLFLSSLTTIAQIISIPYRNGNKWGLADTNGKIIVKPEYDEIKTTDTYAEGNAAGNFFLVKKNGKTGLLSNTQIIMRPQYYFLHVDYVFITAHEQTPASVEREVIYNLKGERLFSDTIGGLTSIPHKMHNGHLLYIITPAKINAGGIFLYNPQKQVIDQWILKGKGYINAIYYRNNVFDLYQHEGNNIPKKFDLIFNEQTNRYDITPAHNNRHEPIIYGTADNNEGFVSSDAYYQDRQSVSNFVIQSNQFSIKGTNPKLTTITSRRNAMTLVKKDSLSFDIAFDKILICNYLSDKVEPHEFRRAVTNNDTVFQLVNYVRFQHNKKWGIIASRTVIPAEFDSVRYFSNGISKPLFLLGKYNPTKSKMIWGIKDSDNKEVVPCAYDEIIRKSLGEFWLTKKEGKYGLIDLKGQVALSPIYDKLSPDRFYLSFQIENNGKFGFITPHAKFYPILPYAVNNLKTIGKYVILEVTDKTGKSLGYADKKGFLYFK